MTFVELVKEVKKECKSNSTRFVVEDILFTALRVFVEELYSDPEHACIDIQNFMKFHLIKDSHATRRRKEDPLVTYHYYRLISTPRKGLKNVLNNRSPIEYYRIATKPLYPENKKPRKKYERKKPYVNHGWKPRPRRERWAIPPDVLIEITDQEDFLRTDIGKRSLEKEKEFKKKLMEKREKERLKEERRKQREARKKKVDVKNLLPEDET